jgi:hypothetical protein
MEVRRAQRQQLLSYLGDVTATESADKETVRNWMALLQLLAREPDELQANATQLLLHISETVLQAAQSLDLSADEMRTLLPALDSALTAADTSLAQEARRRHRHRQRQLAESGSSNNSNNATSSEDVVVLALNDTQTVQSTELLLLQYSSNLAGYMVPGQQDVEEVLHAFRLRVRMLTSTGRADADGNTEYSAQGSSDNSIAAPSTLYEAMNGVAPSQIRLGIAGSSARSLASTLVSMQSRAYASNGAFKSDPLRVALSPHPCPNATTSDGAAVPSCRMQIVLQTNAAQGYGGATTVAARARARARVLTANLGERYDGDTGERYSTTTSAGGAARALSTTLEHDDGAPPLPQGVYIDTYCLHDEFSEYTVACPAHPDSPDEPILIVNQCSGNATLQRTYCPEFLLEGACNAILGSGVVGANCIVQDYTDGNITCLCDLAGAGMTDAPVGNNNSTNTLEGVVRGDGAFAVNYVSMVDSTASEALTTLTSVQRLSAADLRGGVQTIVVLGACLLLLAACAYLGHAADCAEERAAAALAAVPTNDETFAELTAAAAKPPAAALTTVTAVRIDLYTFIIKLFTYSTSVPRDIGIARNCLSRHLNRSVYELPYLT